MEPLVTVAICTRDRAAMLARALGSLAACEAPATPWELVVVDNGSTDDTAATLARSASELPLRARVEPRAGVSHARNRAVDEARGEWILWIDDDVTVDPRWLVAYVHAIARYPEAALLGGTIHARFEGRPPVWIEAGEHWIADAFAVRSSPELAGPIRPERAIPYGANFALRRSVARRFPFDPDLGRHPLHPLRGREESCVMRQILEAGGAGRWVPEAVAIHHIDARRQTARYLKAYYAESGRDAGMRTSREWPRHRLRLACHSLGQACAHAARYRLHRLRGDTRLRALHLKQAAWSWGYTRGCLEISLPGGKTWTRSRGSD